MGHAAEWQQREHDAAGARAGALGPTLLLVQASHPDHSRGHAGGQKAVGKRRQHGDRDTAAAAALADASLLVSRRTTSSTALEATSLHAQPLTLDHMHRQQFGRLLPD